MWRDLLPYVVVSLLALVGVGLYFWLTGAPVDTLPDDYGAM